MTTNFEFRDQDGILFEGKFSYISMIFDTNFLADKYFNEKYNRPRKPEHIIKEWKGSLEIVQVIETLPYPKDQIHKTEFQV